MDYYKSKVNLVSVTPNAEKQIVDLARVSNTSGSSSGSDEKLIQYMIRHGHWSPFEMAHMTVEIFTTRDISRQILRHRSFSFQEFSQRYAEVAFRRSGVIKEARAPHPTNRQASLPTIDADTQEWWMVIQLRLQERAELAYAQALRRGIAKECARVILPEGLTETRLYMSGNVRSWIHYIELRFGNGTQQEHQDVAGQVATIFSKHFPAIWKAIEFRTGMKETQK